MNYNHMMIHELKTIEPYFTQIEIGEKTFECRKDDRPYQKGDYLLLQKYNPISETFTGESLLVRVKHILRGYHGIANGYCVMSITKLVEP